MKILNQEIELKYNLRSMFIFEEIREKPFEVKTLLDTYTLFYSCIVANEKNPHIDINDFIDYCSEHGECIEEFNEFMENELINRNKKKQKKVKNSQ